MRPCHVSALFRSPALLTVVTGFCTTPASLSLAADLDAPAEFVVTDVVGAARPPGITATMASQTLNNTISTSGSFEPMAFRWKWFATEDSPDTVHLSIWEAGADVYNNGFWDGARVRIYRVRNGQMYKVREDVVPEGGSRSSGWIGGIDFWAPVIDADASEYRYVFMQWYRPDYPYYFAIRAVDHQGNRSAVSNEVIVSSTLLVGEEAATALVGTHDEHSFSIPDNPTELDAPLPPSNLAATMDANGVVTFTWTPSPSDDVEGYEFLTSYWPEEERLGYGVGLSESPADPELWARLRWLPTQWHLAGLCALHHREQPLLALAGAQVGGGHGRLAWRSGSGCLG